MHLESQDNASNMRRQLPEVNRGPRSTALAFRLFLCGHPRAGIGEGQLDTTQEAEDPPFSQMMPDTCVYNLE